MINLKEAGLVFYAPIRNKIDDSHVVTSWYLESHLELSIWSEMCIRYVFVVHCCRHYCTWLFIVMRGIVARCCF